MKMNKKMKGVRVNRENLGDVMRRIRVAKGLNQTELAKMLGISVNTISTRELTGELNRNALFDFLEAMDLELAIIKKGR